MLLEKISNRFVMVFLNNNIITPEEKWDFTYGIELTLLFFFDMICLLMIGFVTGKLLEIFFFTLGFTPLKMNAGGYHASTPLYCIITYITIVFLSIFVTKLLMHTIIFIILIGIAFIASFLVLYKYAPVECVNKPLGEEQKRHNRKCTFLIFSLQCIAIMISIIFQLNQYYLYLFIIGIITESLTLMIKERRETDEKTNAYDGI
ncbi:MAG: accessory gene regulator ArgB-like protein [Eubacteriales bacterium]